MSGQTHSHTARRPGLTAVALFWAPVLAGWLLLAAVIPLRTLRDSQVAAQTTTTVVLLLQQEENLADRISLLARRLPASADPVGRGALRQALRDTSSQLARTDRALGATLGSPALPAGLAAHCRALGSLVAAQAPQVAMYVAHAQALAGQAGPVQPRDPHLQAIVSEAAQRLFAVPGAVLSLHASAMRAEVARLEAAQRAWLWLGIGCGIVVLGLAAWRGATRRVVLPDTPPPVAQSQSPASSSAPPEPAPAQPAPAPLTFGPILSRRAATSPRPSASPADPHLANELIELFFTGARTRIADLKRAHGTGDRQSLERAAHTLRGSAESIGAPTIPALCRVLEQSGAAADRTQTARLIDRLETEMSRLASPAGRRALRPFGLED